MIIFYTELYSFWTVSTSFFWSWQRILS